MSPDEQGTGVRGDLPVTADLPGDPTQDRQPTTDRVVFGVTAVLTLAFVTRGPPPRTRCSAAPRRRRPSCSGVLKQFPIATVMSLLVMILVGIFFVSGADAASAVMGTLSQKGIREPAEWVVIFRGVVTGAVAAVMLLIGNGKGDALAGLQNLTVLVAAPFTLVMIGMCVALMRDLREDPLIVRREFAIEVVESAVIEGHAKYAGDFEIRIGPGGSQITTEHHDKSDPPNPPGD